MWVRLSSSYSQHATWRVLQQAGRVRAHAVCARVCVWGGAGSPGCAQPQPRPLGQAPQQSSRAPWAKHHNTPAAPPGPSTTAHLGLEVVDVRGRGEDAVCRLLHIQVPGGAGVRVKCEVPAAVRAPGGGGVQGRSGVRMECKAPAAVAGVWCGVPGQHVNVQRRRRAAAAQAAAAEARTSACPMTRRCPAGTAGRSGWCAGWLQEGVARAGGGGEGGGAGQSGVQHEGSYQAAGCSPLGV